MGFGSYDESEQDNQEYDADLDDDEDGSVSAAENTHDGNVEYEFTASNDELLDRLQEIKDNT